MNIKYLSDCDKDFECLEAYLKNGGLGELKDEWVVSVEKETKLFSEHARNIFENYFDSQVVDSFVEKIYNGGACHKFCV